MCRLMISNYHDYRTIFHLEQWGGLWQHREGRVDNTASQREAGDPSPPGASAEAAGRGSERKLVACVWVMSADGRPARSSRSLGLTASASAREDRTLTAWGESRILRLGAPAPAALLTALLCFLKVPRASPIMGDWSCPLITRTVTSGHTTRLLWSHVITLSLLPGAVHLLCDSTHNDTVVKVACPFLRL